MSCDGRRGLNINGYTWNVATNNLFPACLAKRGCYLTRDTAPSATPPLLTCIRLCLMIFAVYINAPAIYSTMTYR